MVGVPKTFISNFVRESYKKGLLKSQILMCRDDIQSLRVYFPCGGLDSKDDAHPRGLPRTERTPMHDLSCHRQRLS